ncbi:MAG: hypothetical protein GVY33_12630, partial [Alphaproteobacteria bacterium]|nr:hypothetical protein [Alphaproteobacteria bacterium]
MSFLLKQLSVDASPLKFVFCGVANDLSELKMAHESVERYVYAIELRPLAPDAIWAIVEDVAKQFDIEFPHGQIIRISQISAGYPHFTHEAYPFESACPTSCVNGLLVGAGGRRLERWRGDV